MQRYPGGGGATLRLLEISENATFQVDYPDRPSAVLRVHRLGYHSLAAILSELDWIEALRADAGVRTAEVIRDKSGNRVIPVNDIPAGEVRHCVMFERLAGAEPALDEPEVFEELGELTARMHRHARGWSPPAGFTRFKWNCDAAFGPEGRWGRWQDGIGVHKEEEKVLSQLESTLRRRLTAMGEGPDNFGLIHADTRTANLLVDGGRVGIIDFDDCGFGWYLYDLATAFSFFEDDPRVPDLIESWRKGYTRVGQLPAGDSGSSDTGVWTLILFRRLLLLAWLGSHSASTTARQLGSSFTKFTCDLAERYLTGLG